MAVKVLTLDVSLRDVGMGVRLPKISPGTMVKPRTTGVRQSDCAVRPSGATRRTRKRPRVAGTPEILKLPSLRTRDVRPRALTVAPSGSVGNWADTPAPRARTTPSVVTVCRVAQR